MYRTRRGLGACQNFKGGICIDQNPNDAPPVTTMVAPPDVGLLNVTQAKDLSSGGSFKVGDRYRILVSNAAANQPVSILATKDGASLGNSTVGTTNTDGNFQLDGVMDAGTVGNWTEQYFVPGGPSGYPSNPDVPRLSKSISFSVAPVVQTTPDAKVIVKSSGTDPMGSSPVVGPTDPGGFSFAHSFNCDPTSDCWAGFPKWLWLTAGAGLAVFTLGGSHGR